MVRGAEGEDHGAAAGAIATADSAQVLKVRMALGSVRSWVQGSESDAFLPLILSFTGSFQTSRTQSAAPQGLCHVPNASVDVLSRPRTPPPGPERHSPNASGCRVGSLERHSLFHNPNYFKQFLGRQAAAKSRQGSQLLNVNAIFVVIHTATPRFAPRRRVL